MLCIIVDADILIYSTVVCVNVKTSSSCRSICFWCTSDTEEVRENGDVPPSPVQQDDDELQKVKKPGLKMSYEEYKHMANLLVLHMRMVEETASEG